MKKLTCIAVALLAGLTAAQAQEQTQIQEGKWLVEGNTSFGGAGGLGVAGHAANTSFGLSTGNGNTIWSIGFEGGYFIIDNLALKAGLGYTEISSDAGIFNVNTNIFTYKFGAKYYIIDVIPVQMDFTGASIKNADENPFFLGMQGGYALFLGNMVSIEPGLRYNVSLNRDYYDSGILEMRVGFALHF